MSVTVVCIIAMSRNTSRFSGISRTAGGIGLGGLLVLVGLVLFIIPEPATSGLGVALMVLGLIVWAFGLL